QSRLETNLVGGSDRSFIEAVTETAYYTVHMQCSVCRKTHFQQDLAFQLHIASFLGVNRIRLEGDFDRSCCRPAILQYLGSGTLGDLLCSEAARGDALAIAAAVAFSGSGYSITKICAGDRAFDSFCAAGAIALSGARGHVKRSERCCIKLRALLAGAGQSVGISEAAGLNFFDRSVHGRSLRAARTEVASVNELGTSAAHRHLDLRRRELIYDDFRGLDWLRSFAANFVRNNQPRLLKYRNLHGRQQLGVNLRLF